MLNLCGKPSRRFYEFLSIVAKNESEKKELKYLIGKEGKKDLQKLTAESVTVKDLLLKYPSAIPSIDYLIEAIPPIKPRLYSIASSQNVHKEAIELCIILNDWKTPSGKYKTGLNTTFLSKQ